jgi:hypothetical protein
LLDVQGCVALGSNYMDDGQIKVKLQFFQAAKPFLLLDRLQQLQVSCPVRILHGVQVRREVKWLVAFSWLQLQYTLVSKGAWQSHDAWSPKLCTGHCVHCTQYSRQLNSRLDSCIYKHS